MITLTYTPLTPYQIPIHRPGNHKDIIGLLITKELITIDPNAGTSIAELTMRSIPRMWSDTPMSDMLDLFQTGRSHIALLVNRPMPGGKAMSVRSGLTIRGYEDSRENSVHMVSGSGVSY